MDTMQDYLVCYDLVDGDYCEYYETAKDLAEEIENVKNTLEKWGGGHADILDEGFGTQLYGQIHASQRNERGCVDGVHAGFLRS